MNRCPYCGARTSLARACAACSDLPALDPYMQAGRREPTPGEPERLAIASPPRAADLVRRPLSPPLRTPQAKR